MHTYASGLRYVAVRGGGFRPQNDPLPGSLPHLGRIGQAKMVDDRRSGQGVDIDSALATADEKQTVLLYKYVETWSNHP